MSGQPVALQLLVKPLAGDAEDPRSAGDVPFLGAQHQLDVATLHLRQGKQGRVYRTVPVTFRRVDREERVSGQVAE